METSTPSPAALASPPPSPSLASMLRDLWNDPARRPALLGGLGCLGLLGACFGPTLRQLVHVWSSDDNYSHGFLVPPIALYFANEAARRGPIAFRPGTGLGLILLSLAVLGRMATVAIPIGLIGDLSFVVGLAGLLTLMAGTLALRRLGFALGFLVFMVPLPVAMYTMIASPLQELVSRVAAVLLGATGIPVLREGNLLTLPGDVRMFVAEACSGMRQLTGFLALTTAVAYLGNRPGWQRGILVASAVPVAMTANITRVTLTGWIMAYDPALAAGTFHTLEGLLMMGFGLSLLAGECWLLRVLGQLVQTLIGGEGHSSSEFVGVGTPRGAATLSRFPLPEAAR